MKGYCVYESELVMVSDLNTETNLFFSVAGSLFSFGISLWAGALIQGYDGLPTPAKIAVWMGSIGCFILAVISALWANRQRMRRNSMLDDIKSKSYDAGS
jgi:hypothetical protein